MSGLGRAQGLCGVGAGFLDAKCIKAGARSRVRRDGRLLWAGLPRVLLRCPYQGAFQGGLLAFPAWALGRCSPTLGFSRDVGGEVSLGGGSGT